MRPLHADKDPTVAAIGTAGEHLPLLHRKAIYMFHIRDIPVIPTGELTLVRDAPMS